MALRAHVRDHLAIRGWGLPSRRGGITCRSSRSGPAARAVSPDSEWRGARSADIGDGNDSCHVECRDGARGDAVVEQRWWKSRVSEEHPDHVDRDATVRRGGDGDAGGAELVEVGDDALSGTP
jgi:hypothetical protein